MTSATTSTATLVDAQEPARDPPRMPPTSVCVNVSRSASPLRNENSVMAAPPGVEYRTERVPNTVMENVQ